MSDESSLPRLNLSLSAGPEGCSANTPPLALSTGMSPEACDTENLRFSANLSPSSMYQDLYDRLIAALQNQVAPDLGHADDNGGKFIWNQDAIVQPESSYRIIKGIIGAGVDTGEAFQVTGTTHFVSTGITDTPAIFESSINFSGGRAGVLVKTNGASGPWHTVLKLRAPNMPTTHRLFLDFGHDDSTYNTANIGFYYNEDGSSQNHIGFGFWGVENVMAIRANGTVLINQGITDDGTNKLQVNGRAKVGGALYIGVPADWATNKNDYWAGTKTAGITLIYPTDLGNSIYDDFGHGPGLFEMRMGAFNTSTYFGNLALSKLPTTALFRQSDAFGHNALRSSIHGNNAAFAGWALATLSTGSNNAAFGLDAIWLLSTGSGNAGFGQFALSNLREGSGNTGFGGYVASGLYYGDYNTFLGYNVAVPSTTFSKTVIIASGEGGTGAYRFYSPESGNVLFGTTTDMLLEKLQVVGGFRTDTARVTALSGTGIDTVVADANGILYRSGGAVSSSLIQNQIAAGQIANYWITGAGIINGYMNIGVASTANVAKLRVEGEQAVYAGTGRGVYFKNSLTAIANMNTLVGLDIDTTFDVGAYLDVKTLALRTAGGDIQFGSLAGAGTRSLTVLADGTLSTAPLPDADVTATTIIPITGTQNGDNRGFILASEPIAGAALMLFINGQLLHEGNEYTRVGTAITFDPLYPAPTAEKVIMAYGVVIAGTDKYKPITLHIKAPGGITTGIKTFTTGAYAGYITGWQIVSDVVGDIVVDVYKQSYTDFVWPGSAADSITGTEKISLTGARKNRNVNPTTWDNITAEGDMFTFNVDSVSGGITEVVITLFLKESA